MIIDAHAHIFPYLGTPAGFRSVKEHMRVLQFYVVGHSQPVRRLRDHAIVEAPTLARAPLVGPQQLNEVGFHVGENGRFLWKYEGETYYIHFMPPSLQTNACTPELLLAQMAYVGVDVAVLQNAHLYGRLNEYFATAQARYPDKFIALAEVDEVHADSEAELRDLRVAIRDLGLRGIYYANRAFFFDGYRTSFDDPRYDVFWETVRALGIPVFWELAGVPENTRESYLREVDRLHRWATRYPEIPAILTHGLDPELLKAPIPEPLARLLAHEQVWIEILYPIGWGRAHEYPYPELRPALQALYDCLGGERLVWGSDMPNVERNCTYRQSLDYLRRYCPFIPSRDMDSILGGNLAELFGLA
jgi:predicted TIM-barrel fold metal-dependent hydrolase